VEHGGTHHIDTAVSRNGDDRLKGSEIDTDDTHCCGWGGCELAFFFSWQRKSSVTVGRTAKLPFQDSREGGRSLIYLFLELARKKIIKRKT
jgi:hypothetical protein